jgi:hypothetical protein
MIKKIMSEEDITKLQNSGYIRVDKLVKKMIPEEVGIVLKEKMKIDYIEHVSINLKTDQIFNLIDYTKKIQDKQFLLFYGRMRNSVHSNYVYYGNPDVYEFGGITYSFQPNEPIDMSPLILDDDLSIFNISIELRDIFQRIINEIEYDGLILDPSYVISK